MNINSGRVRMLNGNSSCCRPLQGDLDLHIKRLRVCLVEWILGRMKKKKKIEEGKLFGVFVWEGGERKKMVGPGTHQKVLFPKWGVN